MAALRYPFAIGWGGLVSLGLFWMLWMLVGVEFDVGPPLKPADIEFTPLIVESPPKTKRQEKIERTPPPPLVQPPRIGGSRDLPGEATPFTPARVATGISNGATFSPGVDRDPLPLVRVEPDYPLRAITSSTEGWVRVQFTVSEIGAVEDAFVVDADPERVFDDAALRAVARWRYQPKVADGVPVERVGMQTVFRFTLEE